MGGAAGRTPLSAIGSSAVGYRALYFGTEHPIEKLPPMTERLRSQAHCVIRDGPHAGEITQVRAVTGRPVVLTKHSAASLKDPSRACVYTSIGAWHGERLVELFYKGTVAECRCG